MPDPSPPSSRVSAPRSGPPPAAARPEPYPIEWLRPSPWQPRRPFPAAELQPLVDSIRRYGFLGSLPARRDPADPQGPPQLLFGHRRLEAAKLAGLRTVPVALLEGVDDEAARLLVFAENDTFAALSPLEQAEYLDTLMRETGWSFRDTAERLGKSVGWILNRVRLLRLPPYMREAAHTGAVDFSILSEITLQPEAEWAALFARAKRGALQLYDLRRGGGPQAPPGGAAPGAPAAAGAAEPAPHPPAPPSPPSPATEGFLRRRSPAPGSPAIPEAVAAAATVHAEAAAEPTAIGPTPSEAAARGMTDPVPAPPGEPMTSGATDPTKGRLRRAEGLVADLERTCAGPDRPALSGDQRRRRLALRDRAWRALSPG
jgi:ParB/RepB/Spo0J family partition protein